MKREISALLAGLLFGTGLAAASMTDPRKVLAFLDLLGDWNPTLAYVMGTAVAVTWVAFRVALRRPAPILDDKFHIPTRRDIDYRLVVGSLLFGIGWGLFGYCPGPAIGALVYGHAETMLFVAAMLAGVFIEWGVRRATLGSGQNAGQSCAAASQLPQTLE